MPSLTPEALAQFEQEVDDVFLAKLAGYTLNQIRGKTWCSAFNGNLPSGKQIEDIVAESAADLLLGERAWDPVVHPKLFGFLCDIIDSKVSHLVESAENRKSAVAKEDDPEQKVYVDPLADRHHSSPDDLAMHKEKEARNEAVFSAVIDFFSDDPLIQKLLGCTMDGIGKRAEIAAELGVSEQEITNARKRMERRFPEFREKILPQILSATP